MGDPAIAPHVSSELKNQKRPLSPFMALRRAPGWSVGACLVSGFVMLPLLVVLVYASIPAGDVWKHLYETVLGSYVVNSVLLMLGVAVGVMIGGTGCAWLTSMCQFPGRATFEWALLLPMALPAYIIAYTYTGMLDFAGPVQQCLRDVFGWGYGDYWFPEVRSLGGAIIMLSLVLFPYVYLLTRAAFLNQSLCVLDVSRTLGNGPWRTFSYVALPLARPAIASGVSLALMETLADYGTVQYFGIDTFTTGIFRTWYGFDNAAAAAQLAVILLVFVLLLILLERGSRRKSRYHQTSQRHQDIRRIVLQGWSAFGAVAFCGLAVLAGFALPAGQLVWWSFTEASQKLDHQFLLLVWHTVQLGCVAAGISVSVALFLGYSQRLSRTRFVRGAVHFASMGYAIPGTVIAIGVIIPLAWMDQYLISLVRQMTGETIGLVLSGSIVALLFAYLVRFLAVALHAVQTGLGRVKPSLDEAARSLGYSPREVVSKVHFPILKGSILTAVLLVFVDVMKELPATLILRPFDYNTLAVRAYEMAMDERLADAAPAALCIVAAGIIPVFLLSRTITKSRNTYEEGSK
jgi:iron(III) transport system permease protein